MHVTAAMRPRGPLFGAVALALAAMAGTAAVAQAAGSQTRITVETAEFVVSLNDGEGGEQTIRSNVVPFLPDRACFGWRIRLADPPPIVRYKEVLQLPAAPAYWSGEDDSYSTHSFSADRTTATTEAFAAPDDGWIESTWCIAEGDPTGAHFIEVHLEGTLVRRFDFDVKTFDQPLRN